MELAEITRISVADQVASILRQRILNGELPPGTALQEISTAASLGVSRNTVREATRILSLEGLLKRSAHRGVSVAQLFLKDVAEIYQVRRLLEIPAGSHTIEIRNSTFPSHVEKINLKAGEARRIQHRFR